MPRKPHLPDINRPLVVLYSFGPHTDEANPYVRLLTSAVSTAATVRFFSWTFALFGSYDLFHLHWPEALIRRRSVRGRVASRVLLSLLLVRWAVTRTPILRTEHNLRPHESGTRVERALLQLLDRQTSAWIVMAESPSGSSRANTYRIPHGHYGDWYRLDIRPTRFAGSVLNFGLLRPYKGVEQLINAFRCLPTESGLHLQIMGKPHDEHYAASLENEVSGLPNVHLDLRHIPDNDLAQAIAAAQLVVLPYRDMHNSGALLLALSLKTAVMVPKNEMSDALAAEVGECWVQRFSGTISADAILAATRAVEHVKGRPDLSARNWESIGAQHLEAYLEVAKKRG